MYLIKKQNRLLQTNLRYLGGQISLAPFNIEVTIKKEMERVHVIQSDYSKKLR